MKEAIEKLSQFVEELDKTADPTLGGGYIVIGAGPVEENSEEGTTFLTVMNGKRIELMTTMAYAFHRDPDLADIAKHALMFGSLVPSSMRPRPAKEEEELRVDNTETDSGEETNEE